MDENLGLGVLQCIYAGYLFARLLEFGLGSFGALCNISNFTFFYSSAPLTIFIRFIQTLYKAS